MKRIGILGGMSPESTIEYYDTIVHQYIEQYGSHHYPEMIIFSVRFGDYIPLMEKGDWDAIGGKLTDAAKELEKAGADFIIIATNTMHKVVDEIRAGLKIPVLSLLDVLCAEIQRKGIHTVALLGTAYTMEDGFYDRHLMKFGIQVITPSKEERDYINCVIWEELIAGIILDESKRRYLEIIDQLIILGAEGVILGCTEIPLLVKESDVLVPVFNTTVLHANAALSFSLDE